MRRSKSLLETKSNHSHCWSLGSAMTRGSERRVCLLTVEKQSRRSQRSRRMKLITASAAMLSKLLSTSSCRSRNSYVRTKRKSRTCSGDNSSWICWVMIGVQKDDHRWYDVLCAIRKRDENEQEICQGQERLEDRLTAECHLPGSTKVTMRYLKLRRLVLCVYLYAGTARAEIFENEAHSCKIESGWAL